MKPVDLSKSARATRDFARKAASATRASVRKTEGFLEKAPIVLRTGNLVLTAIGAIAISFFLARGLDFLTVPYVIFCAASLMSIGALIQRLNRNRKLWTGRLDSIGFVFVVLAVLLGGWAWLLRMQPERRFLVGLTYMIVCLVWVFPRLHRPTSSMRAVRFKVAFLGCPFLLAWIIASSLHSLHARSSAWGNTFSASVADHIRPAFGVAEHSNINAAMALSGGGYRAAAIHAGVLRELEDQGFPINYLSTVSGGSIVGAWYALGHRAEDFQSLLLARKLWWTSKPGLVNDVFHIANISAELFLPTWRDSDTLASHLSRVFFGESRLKDVAGRTPRLIVNATDRTTRSRWIFAASDPGDSAIGASLYDDVRLADVVAASGAFPAAFEPKVVGCREFVDGGVIENLGVLGIREFFEDREERPNVVVISDVSKIPEDSGAGSPAAPSCSFKKHFVTDQLNRVVDTMGVTGSRELYRVFTGEKYDGEVMAPGVEGQPFQAHLHDVYHHAEQGCFRTFVFAPTTGPEQTYLLRLPASMKTYAIGAATERITDEDVKGLPDISTLAELTRREIYAAGWAGQMVARRHLEEAKRRTGDLWAFLAQCRDSEAGGEH